MMSSESEFKSEYDCWQDMERSRKIDKLLKDDILADCTFLVGPENSTPEKIKGHKVMFILESPILEKMLAGSFVEAEKNHEIRITDVFPQDFKNFRYMVYHNDYSKYPTFSLEELFELYRIADKYLVSSISKDCLRYLKSCVHNNLHIDKIITMFEYASKIPDKSLLAQIEKQISLRDATAIMTEKINELPLEIFYNYILLLSTKQPVAVKPSVIFGAINCYLKKNGLIEKKDVSNTMDMEKLTDKDAKETMELKDISDFKKRLLRLVNFQEMTPLEFTDGPGKSCLLEIQRKYDIISFLATKAPVNKCTNVYPNGYTYK